MHDVEDDRDPVAAGPLSKPSGPAWEIAAGSSVDKFLPDRRSAWCFSFALRAARSQD